MKHTDYILLPQVPWDLVLAPARTNWRRRVIQASLVLVIVTAGLYLFQLVSYVPDVFDGVATTESLEEAADLSLDAAYMPFKLPNHALPAVTNKRLKPVQGLPATCLDDHIAYGKPCHALATPPMDVVWTWVNGSDALLQDAKEHVESLYALDNPYRPFDTARQARQFRDHDELRHSMRSVLAGFRKHSGHFHLVTGDFAIPATEPKLSISAPWRLGQIPQWLDTTVKPSSWKDGETKLAIIHHGQIFEPYNDTIFNSYAIESQFGHLQTVSENFVYMNDDFFFTSPVTQRTFHTSAYGIVLRMQSDLTVSPVYNNNIGEWGSLARSNALLSSRFGIRHRPYMTHEAKGASIPLLNEISHIWADDIANTATHPFRETKSGDSDLSMMFMMIHFVVERWREALLWSWVVGRIGGADDSWGNPEMRRAWKELGGDDSLTGIVVRSSWRDTLEAEKVAHNLAKSGYKQKDGTTYSFSSADGYPYTQLGSSGVPSWPQFNKDRPTESLPVCSIDYATCFTDDRKPFTRASDLFSHIAFRSTMCGDCVISSLIRASGSAGLSAFLPEKSRIISSLAGKVVPLEEDVPHLPLVDKWELGDFSLREVMRGSRGVKVRDWTLRLLERYRFVIGDTPSHFAMLTSPNDANTMIRTLEGRPENALLCINDDVMIDNDKVSQILTSWLKEQWPQPAAWEKI